MPPFLFFKDYFDINISKPKSKSCLKKIFLYNFFSRFLDEKL